MTIISIKRKTLAILLIVAVAAALCSGMSCGVVYAVQKVEEKVVVVDAGHGGIDGGVVGSTGVKESDLNLLIAQLLQKELESGGVRVVMTRTDQNAIGSTKKEDMQNRKAIIVRTKPDIVVSVHINKFSSSKRRGVQVFYDDTGVGQNLAEYLQSSLNTEINAKYSSRCDYTAIKADLFITKCYACPSVIVECGFLSNIEDEKLLLTSQYRQEVAQVIARSCLDILGE